MNESVLLKISIIISIFGMIALFLISKNIELTDTTIEKINNGEISGKVIISGSIREIQNNGKSTILIIEQTSELKAIVFSNISLNEGDNVEILGEKSEDIFVVDSLKTI